MADVDTSIYSKFAPQPVNPLDMASKALSLGVTGQQMQAGALNNRLLGQQVNGKIALGRAVTGATDAQTGETDWNKALSNLAKDPEGSFQVPELAGTVLDRKLKELQNQGADLDLTAKRWGKIGDFAGSLLAEKDPLTRPQVIKLATDRLVDSGMFNDEHSIHQLTSFIANLPEDDAGLRKSLQGVALQSNLTTERISNILGSVNPVDTGPTTAMVQTSPLGGPPQVRGTIAKGLSPETATSPTPVMVRNPDGTMTPSAITREQFVAASGQGPVATSAPISKLGRSGSETAGMVDVYDPVAKQMVKKPSGQIVGDALPAGGGAPAPAAPALGEASTAEANVHQSQALQQRASIVPQRRAALSNLVNTLDKFTPGPKADWTYQLGALATMAGQAPPSVKDGVAAQEEFNKLAAQIALDQWGTLGGTGSNEQLATAMKANPNHVMSTLGIKNVVAMLQGNEDAIGSQFDAWQKYAKTHGPGSYGDFLQGWNRYYDPRVFQAEHMTAGAVKQLEAKMSPDERKTFLRNRQVARSAGWIGGQ